MLKFSNGTINRTLKVFDVTFRNITVPDVPGIPWLDARIQQQKRKMEIRSRATVSDPLEGHQNHTSRHQQRRGPAPSIHVLV